MSLDNGILGLIVVIIGMLGELIFNLFGENIENKELIKNRIRQSLIVGILLTIVWALFFAYFNKNRVELLSGEENKILLYIFVSASIITYIIEVCSTLIHRIILKCSSKKNKKNESHESVGYLSNFLTSILLGVVIIFLIKPIFNFVSPKIPKSVTIEDSIILIENKEYILPKNTRFELNYVSVNPGGKNPELYEYKYDNTEYVLEKGTIINLFKNSELHKKEPDKIVFQKNNQYADAKIVTNENTVIQLKKDLNVSLKSDVRVKINNIDLITFYVSFNFIVVTLLLIMYHTLNVVDWNYLKNLLKINRRQ